MRQRRNYSQHSYWLSSVCVLSFLRIALRVQSQSGDRVWSGWTVKATLPLFSLELRGKVVKMPTIPQHYPAYKVCQQLQRYVSEKQAWLPVKHPTCTILAVWGGEYFHSKKMNQQVFGESGISLVAMLEVNKEPEYWNTVVTLGWRHMSWIYCPIFIQMLEWKVAEREILLSWSSHIEFICPSFPSCYIRVYIVSPPTLLPPPLLLPPQLQVCLSLQHGKTAPHSPPKLAPQ